MLTVGGRYVCGNPNSLMLAWLEPKGPLNYRQLEELIAFIRAPSTLTYTTVDPETGATTEQTGWRDESYAMPAGATPVPACWKDAFGGRRRRRHAGALRRSLGGPVRGARRRRGAAHDHRLGDRLRHGQPGGPGRHALPDRLHQQRRRDPPQRGHPRGQPHGRARSGPGEIFNGVETRTYDVPALPAGTYGFVCTVHPNMTGTLTAR